MLTLAAEDYALEMEPERGGSIASFRWRGADLLRATCGPSILDTACFPLVPFSNRIANGRFSFGGREVALAPNLPGRDHPHAIHGLGWTARWRVVDARPAVVRMEHGNAGGDWPWIYRALQTFRLTGEGLTVELAIENLGGTTMPAGLGFHPYFPRDDAIYRGCHRGEWTTSDDGLPITLDRRGVAIDWWAGAPVGSRAVDTVYEDREGPISIRWPGRGIELTMRPSDGLPHTVVYSPAGEDFFCVEPVSHATDAFNRSEANGFLRLRSGEGAAASMRLSAAPHEG